MAEVELRGVSRVFPGGVAAVDGVDLAVARGEFLVIVGPSGSGKSTLLRLISGLEPLSAGSVWVEGKRVDRLPPHLRDVAMVFQTPALFPHLNVAANMAFGLKARGVARRERHERVQSAAAMLGIIALLERRPGALSGGERQRVALGRAIARRAKLVLLDEPLSNLDAPLRVATRADLIDVHRATGATMILVTHDQAEALALGDRVGVLNAGKLEQLGTPREVYDLPATRFVASFIGSPPMNLLECELRFQSENAWVELPDADAMLVTPSEAAWLAPVRLRAGRVVVGLRSEHVHHEGSPTAPVPHPGAGQTRMTARVVRLEPQGHETIVTLATASGASLRTRVGHSLAPSVGDEPTLVLDLSRAVWFDPTTGAILQG